VCFWADKTATLGARNKALRKRQGNGILGKLRLGEQCQSFHYFATPKPVRTAWQRTKRFEKSGSDEEELVSWRTCAFYRDFTAASEPGPGVLAQKSLEQCGWRNNRLKRAEFQAGASRDERCARFPGIVARFLTSL